MRSGLPYIPNEMMEYYTNLAYTIFQQDVNGKINPINHNAKLSVVNYSFANRTFGEFIYPNEVKLVLADLIDAIIWIGEYNLYDRIITAILFILLHEAGHSEQKLDMELYYKDSSYKSRVENTNDMRTYIYLLINREELESRYNFQLCDDGILGLPRYAEIYRNYSKEQLIASYNEISSKHYFKNLGDLYQCYLMNLIKREKHVNSILSFNTIYIEIKDIPTGNFWLCPIKINGIYCEPFSFNETIYEAIKQYDTSKYSINFEFINDSVKVIFGIRERFINVLTD